jgi:hypothetical protein
MRAIASLILFAVAAACSRGPDRADPVEATEPAPAEPAAAVEVEPASSPEAALAGAETAAPAVDPLSDRLWALTPGDGRPGVFRVFLSSGAMMQGSCVETYRVSEWRRGKGGEIVWSEDGTEITADVLSLDAAGLTLGLNLADGRKVETYAAAAAPFVCPDLPR